HEDPEVLRYLGKSGLQPGALITLLSRTPYDQTMRVQIEGNDEEVVIGPSLGAKVFIKIDG
ncbi:MAG: FeoA family protein, partial [Chloroflexota bacterium]|nr:FeoA family protein [Chloroflexota bacterium]